MTHQANLRQQPQVAIYACGGTGLNLGEQFSRIISENPILKNTVRVYYVDTSTANHREAHTPENTKVIGTKEGSGKRRDKNYDHLKECVPEILHSFQPGKFNIMLAGLSGGSGSVIQGVLLSELLAKSIPAMTVAVGSGDSEREVLNLNQSFLSFASVARTRQKPVVVNYTENGTAGSRGEVDRRVLDNLTNFCLMFSGVAEEIDYSDIAHFLDYSQTTKFPVGLVALEIYKKSEIKLRDGESLFGVTTLATRDTPTTLTPRPPYQSTGFISDDQVGCFGDFDILHFAILGGAYDQLIQRNKTNLAEFDEAAKAYRPVQHLDSSIDAQDDGNIV